MEGLAALSQSFGQTIAQGLPGQVQQRRELDQRKAEADVTAKNAERGLGIQERYAATAEQQAALAAEEAKYNRSLNPTPEEAAAQRGLQRRAGEAQLAEAQFGLERKKSLAPLEDETARLALEDQKLRNKIAATFGMESAKVGLDAQKQSLIAARNQASESMVSTLLRVADFQRQGEAIGRADKRADAQLGLAKQEFDLRKSQMVYDNALRRLEMATNVVQQNKQMLTQLASIQLSGDVELNKHLVGPLAEAHGVVPGSPEHQVLANGVLRAWKALSGATTYALGSSTGQNAEAVADRMSLATKDLSLLSDQFAAGKIDAPTYDAKVEDIIKESMRAVDRVAAPDPTSTVEPDPADVGPYTWFAGNPMTATRQVQVRDAAKRAKELGTVGVLQELDNKNPGTYVSWQGKIRDLPTSLQLNQGVQADEGKQGMGSLAKRFLDRELGGEDEPKILQDAYEDLIMRQELTPDERVDDRKVFFKVVKHAYLKFREAALAQNDAMRTYLTYQ